MPTLAENNRFWGNDYDWKQGGDEWSEVWGGAEMQWYGTLLPRIHKHLPAGTILEIAPGFGRWTHFFADLCERLIVVDMSDKCIDACKQRFQDRSHIQFHVNDGKSLEVIDDNSIDFVFSFDSLVHAEADVVEAYLSQLSRKLKPGGVGFIHHQSGRVREILSNVCRHFEVSQAPIHPRASGPAGRSPLASAQHDIEEVSRVCRGERAAVHQPGEDQLGRSAHDRLPFGVHQGFIAEDL